MGLRTVTPASDDEWEPIDRAIAMAFGGMWEARTDEQLAAQIERMPFDQRIGIVEGDGAGDAIGQDEHVLGGCGAFPFVLTLPGGAVVPVSGLTAVGIDPTLVGRGGFRLMMEEHLRRARAAGAAASVLNASESSLYGRFGYGAATTVVGWEIGVDRVDVRTPVDAGGRMVSAPVPRDRLDDFLAAFDRVAPQVAGTIGRDRNWWELVLGPDKGWAGGGKQLGVVHLDADGAPDGYVLYEVENGYDGWVPGNIAVIRELVAADAGVELALFHFVATMPLVRTVRWPEGPVDPVIAHHLVDPRQLRATEQHDLLWLRPLDVPRLLADRSWGSDGSLVLGIDDPLFDDQRGPWRLDVADGRGEVSPSDDPADLVLKTQHLGRVLLGDVRIVELARAGVIDGDADVIRRADRLFLTDRRPVCIAKF